MLYLLLPITFYNLAQPCHIQPSLGRSYVHEHKFLVTTNIPIATIDIAPTEGIFAKTHGIIANTEENIANTEENIANTDDIFTNTVDIFTNLQMKNLPPQTTF